VQENQFKRFAHRAIGLNVGMLSQKTGPKPRNDLKQNKI